MRNREREIQRIAEQLTKKYASEGRLIEAGWQTYRVLCLRSAVNDSCGDLKEAFQAGAEHVFASMVNMLEADEEVTDNDLKRMDHLQAEVELIQRAFRLKYGKAEGKA